MNEPLPVLGINAVHDASVVVLDRAGRIQLAVAEERLNRLKSFCGWPRRALSLVPPGKYHVAVSNLEKSWRNQEKRFHDYLFDGVGTGYFDIFNEYRLRYALSNRSRVDAVSRITHELKQNGIQPETLTFYEHHLCHAASAFYTSGFADSLVVTADGAGDGLSSTVWAINSGRWQRLCDVPVFHSAGLMYSWVTRLAGFKISRHEGKITGLAAYGDPEKVSVLRGHLLRWNETTQAPETPYMAEFEVDSSLLRSLRALLRNQAIHIGYLHFEHAVANYLGKDFHIQDLAALAQEELERVFTSFLRHYVMKTGQRKVALAGGVFSNVRLNQRIREIPELEEMWVFPDMGDGGTAAGAAFLAYRDHVRAEFRGYGLEDVYLGPGFHEHAMRRTALEGGLYACERVDAAVAAAALVAAGKVVGWYQGRMEYGPRALGNRSILVHPGDRNINQTLNRRLKRTEFMPFAPVCLEECASEVFEGWDKGDRCAEFMTVTYNVNPRWKEKLQAVVHVDGTARPQVIRRQVNYEYYRVLEAFRRLTGLPAMINTSFNMHEEPIVCTCDDAVRAFGADACDYLIMGGDLYARSEAEMEEARMLVKQADRLIGGSR